MTKEEFELELPKLRALQEYLTKMRSDFEVRHGTACYVLTASSGKIYQFMSYTRHREHVELSIPVYLSGSSFYFNCYYIPPRKIT